MEEGGRYERREWHELLVTSWGAAPWTSARVGAGAVFRLLLTLPRPCAVDSYTAVKKASIPLDCRLRYGDILRAETRTNRRGQNMMTSDNTSTLTLRRVASEDQDVLDPRLPGLVQRSLDFLYLIYSVFDFVCKKKQIGRRSS